MPEDKRKSLGAAGNASGITWRRCHLNSPCESSSVSDDLARHAFGEARGNGMWNNREGIGEARTRSKNLGSPVYHIK